MSEQDSENVQRSEPASDDTWAGLLLKGSEQDLEAAKGARDRAEADFEAAKGARDKAKQDLKDAEEAKGVALKRHSEDTEAVKRARNEHDTAEKNLSDSIARLGQIQRGLLELRGRQNQARLEGSEAKLQELDSQIQDKLVEVNRDSLTAAEQKLAPAEERFAEAEQELVRAKDSYTAAVEALKKAKQAVFKAAVALNGKAAVLPWKRLKTAILDLCVRLPFSGATTAGVGYVYVVIVGATYEFIFYDWYEFDIFDYATFSDFFLSGSKLVVIPFICLLATSFPPFAFYWLISRFACLPIPRYAEGVAAIFPRFAEWIPVKKSLAAVFIILSLGTAVLAGRFHAEHVDKDSVPVSVVTTTQFQQTDNQTDNLARIGSNSTYTFFKRLDTNETSTILAIPLSQIVCISKTGECKSEGPDTGNGIIKKIAELAERNIALHEEHNLLVRTLIAAYEHGAYVTESLLRQYVAEEMECTEEGQQVHISKFIRFNRDKAEIEANPANKDNLDNFVSRWVGKDGVVGRAVFGFASPDGERKRNNSLSGKRAEAVKDRMCPPSSNNEADCKAEFGNIEIKDSGENHPINGVANSRSAVIAVCVQQDGIS